MELFLPSFLILLLASIVVFTVIPRFGPHVLTVIAIGLLGFGAYHHWSMFRSEYRLATWHEPLKQIAPAIVLGAMFLFVLGYALTFFGGSGIPVPAVPELSGAVASVANTASSITNTVKNAAMQAVNTVGNIANKAVNTVSGSTNGLRSSFRRNNNSSIFNIGSLPNKLP